MRLPWGGGPAALVDHVAELGLPFVTRGRATLANGSEDFFDIFGVAVLWESQLLYVLADAADTTPLLGMVLLDCHSLFVEVERGGRVVIQAKE